MGGLPMRTVMRKMTWLLLAVLCVAARPAMAGPQNVPGLKVDKSSIGGTVANSNGGKAEAGVWVIAETKSLPAPRRRARWHASRYERRPSCAVAERRIRFSESGALQSPLKRREILSGRRTHQRDGAQCRQFARRLY